MKTCSKCGKWLPVDEFYRHPATADRRFAKCKTCTKTYAAQNYARRREYYRAYNRKRNSGGAGLQKMRDFRHRYPEKYRAHNIVHYALRTGRLMRRPCEECGTGVADAHHDDYTKPLEVRWLCRLHHNQLHGQRRAS